MNQHLNFVPTASATRQVYDWLLRRVLTGDLPPGARLSETEIAAETGVSRQPVREAFIRLAADGLAEIRPQRGTFIGKISVQAVLSARLIREAVESDLIRLCAGRITPGMLAELDHQLDQQQRAIDNKDSAAFVQLDDDFHRYLAEAAGQPHVWTVLEPLKAQMNRLRHITARELQPAPLVGQHAAIVKALRRGDTDAAEAAMRDHLRMLLTDLPAIRAARPEVFQD